MCIIPLDRKKDDKNGHLYKWNIGVFLYTMFLFFYVTYNVHVHVCIIYNKLFQLQLYPCYRTKL